MAQGHNQTNIFAAVQLGFQVYSEYQHLQTLHGEPRFNFGKQSVSDLLTTVGTSFFAGDAQMTEIIEAAKAAIAQIQYHAPATPATPTPVPAQGGGV